LHNTNHLAQLLGGLDMSTADELYPVSYAEVGSGRGRLRGGVHYPRRILSEATVSPSPTDEQIAALPRLAWVALAARAARRVLPAFRRGWPNVPEEHQAALAQAVEFAESAATRGSCDSMTARPVAAAVGRAESAVSAAEFWSRPGATGAHPGVSEAFARANVVSALQSRIAAATASLAAVAAASPAASREAALAVRKVSQMGLALGGNGALHAFILAGWADYDRLAALAAGGHWTNDTPVSSDVFGPLWPDELAGALPPVEGAARWLAGQVGDFTPRPAVAWGFALGGDGFPDGVRATVSVPEWGLTESRTFTCREVDSENYFKGELLALWGKVLGAYQRSILDRLSRPEVA
jgi:hypothetical protein